VRVSKKANLLFIHIPKNAGRSIWELMERKCPDTKKIAWAHARLKDVHKRKTNRYKRFGVVRNPWDRMVSLYHFLCQTKDSFMAYDYVEYPISLIPELGFEKWLLEYGKVSHRKQKLVLTKTPQYDWMTINGKLACDVVRYENLKEDLKKIIDFKDSELEWKHKSKRGGYREMYNDKTKDFVAKYFKKDVEEFGYEF
jgi:hypothetical protein